VDSGSQIGFSVALANAGTATANGIAVTDNLPPTAGVDWTIGSGTDPGWSIVGSPPNESLAYSQSTLAAGASTHVHVVSATDAGTCGSTLQNTASFTSTDGGSGDASASVSVLAPPTSLFGESFDGVIAPTLPLG